jgi:hypothetical protein
MTAVLYAVPASHPCAVVERPLQLKDVPYVSCRATAAPRAIAP